MGQKVESVVGKEFLLTFFFFICIWLWFAWFNAHTQIRSCCIQLHFIGRKFCLGKLLWKTLKCLSIHKGDAILWLLCVTMCHVLILLGVNEIRLPVCSQRLVGVSANLFSVAMLIGRVLNNDGVM